VNLATEGIAALFTLAPEKEACLPTNDRNLMVYSARAKRTVCEKKWYLNWPRLSVYSRHTAAYCMDIREQLT
jgi:hypothetical protein